VTPSASPEEVGPVPSTVRSWLSPFALAALIVVPHAVQAQDSAPLTAEEEASLQSIRDFVGATAKRYRMVSTLDVSVASWVGNPSLPQYASSPAVKSGNQLFLNRRLLRTSNRASSSRRPSPTRCCADPVGLPRSPTDSASGSR
jgi:hypothetical protein